jgi:hypothetical protein
MSERERMTTRMKNLFQRPELFLTLLSRNRAIRDSEYSEARPDWVRSRLAAGGSRIRNLGPRTRGQGIDITR